ncbi:MAG: TIGR00725 family protein [Candidatus Thorarchaeota archaeon]
MIRNRITVIGSSGRVSREITTLAEEIGRVIAQNGAILISGGKNGVMEAASKGAKSANGITVGILPEAYESAANPFIDIPLATGIGYARNFINIVSGNSIISLAGSSGTLSEIGYAIALEKRLILMEGTGGVTEMIINHMDLFPNADIHTAENGEQAVRIALDLENP